jgi:tetratricopeptide (TPR) repeat protein
MGAPAFTRALLLVLLASHLAAASLDEAKRLFEERRLPQARAAFEALARSGPSRAEATFFLGRIEFVLDDSAKAAKLFEKAIELDPKNARYRLWVGRMYGEMAQGVNPIRAASLAKKVQRAFEEAVRLDAKYIDPRIGLIDFYQIAPGFMGGSDEKANEHLAEIERIDPPYGHLVRARMHRRAKKPELVTKEYDAAVRRFPNDPRVHLWRSGAYSADGTWDIAIQEAAEAVRLDPSYMPGHYHVGRTAASSGQNLQAGEGALKKYIAYVPKDDEPSVTQAHYLLGLIYEKLGRKDEARVQLREALRRAPKYEEAKKALARVGA